MRMREWRDVHAQLDRHPARSATVSGSRRCTTVGRAFTPDGVNAARRNVSEVNPDPLQLAFGTPAYARHPPVSILAGLLGNIAHLDEEHGGYKATHDRRVTLFPGSALFRREEPRKRENDAAPRDAPKKGAKPPRWIIAAEMMETTRLFARTCARLDPLWALDLGAHVVRVAHSEPFWSEEQGRVLVKQRTRLHGLELESRAVSYGKSSRGTRRRFSSARAS